MGAKNKYKSLIIHKGEYSKGDYMIYIQTEKHLHPNWETFKIETGC